MSSESWSSFMAARNPEDVADGYEDGEYDYKIMSKAEHTARKNHACDACEGPIQPGQRYKKIVVLDEGKLSVTKWHVDRDQCAEAGLLQRAWEREQYEIYGDCMAEHMMLETAFQCHTCHGWGADPDDGCDWTPCPLCGGVGTWDSGEVFPDAYHSQATEPRIPADITNVFRPQTNLIQPNTEGTP